MVMPVEVSADERNRYLRLARCTGCCPHLVWGARLTKGTLIACECSGSRRWPALPFDLGGGEPVLPPCGRLVNPRVFATDPPTPQ